jgi:hypothetical protein
VLSLQSPLLSGFSRFLRRRSAFSIHGKDVGFFLQGLNQAQLLFGRNPRKYGGIEDCRLILQLKTGLAVYIFSAPSFHSG